MAESLSEMGKTALKGGLDLFLSFIKTSQGGEIKFRISTDNIEVARELCQLAGCVVIGIGVVSLGGLLGYRLLRLLIKDATNEGLGGNRDDQRIAEIGPGSLHVLLHCFTDKRFLKVLEDFESGKIKQRLVKEFMQVGIKVAGLNVKIENMEEINETKKAITKRSTDATDDMIKSEAKMIKNADLPPRSNQGFQIDISKHHANWLNVGELIRTIQKPISIYVDEIVQALHEKLCKDLLPIGKCSNPEDCNKKTKPNDLCISCKRWCRELAASHEKTNNPLWYKNCKSAKWSEDHWEVAKFFMPVLGSNLDSAKDAKSTDISSLLNVLEWMNNGAFLGKGRVNVDFVRNLRSQVRNTWAHAPRHELDDDEMVKGFSIAKDFLENLEKVWSKEDNKKCLEHLGYLETNKVAKVSESELQSLLLQRHLLINIKEEVTKIEFERSSDKNTLEEHGQKLTNLERALDECSKRMSDLKNFKDNMNEQFNNLTEDLKAFRDIPGDINEIRDSIGQILQKMNDRQKEKPKMTSCLPDRLEKFTARATEIQKVITFIVDKEKAVVSLHGGPGFGKTAIAIEVSYKLSEDHKIRVVFSQLNTATSVDELIRQLCRDVGVNHEDEGSKPSLILWLKNMKGKVIFVMDDIDKLLEDASRSAFYEFVRFLRKSSNQHCQIVTTSRMSFEIPELVTEEVSVEEMDVRAGMKLMRKHCPEHVQDDDFLQKLGKLCGQIPLAMCIAVSRVDDFHDSEELLEYLQQQPMKTLESRKRDEYVHKAINMSYEKCSDEEKETLNRLTVFDGSFDLVAAEAVNEKKYLNTIDILNTLVDRSLIKQIFKHRYSLHLLIKHFLIDQQKKENEIGELAEKSPMHAELLMVKYYLKLGHDLTMKSYTENGYKESREALKKEAHNIRNVLKICCIKNDPTNSGISDCIAQSEVYTDSARFFSLLVRTIIPNSIVDDFLRQCADMAEKRMEHARKINFDCLLADQERMKSIGRDIGDFEIKMEKIRKEFETHKEDLKEDKSLRAHYSYLYGKYLLRKSEGQQNRLDLQRQARNQLRQSLELRESFTSTSVGKADRIFSLLHLGHAHKVINASERCLGTKEDSENSLEDAKERYLKAIELSQRDLGDHELTSSCHKSLGDLYLKIHKPQDAEEEYKFAKTMRESLGLDTSERHVFLLNNLGHSLKESNRPNEAISLLENARDLAEKLAESDEPNKCKAKVYTTLAIAHHLRQKYCADAVKYAEQAMKFHGLHDLEKKNYKILEDILQKTTLNN